MGAESPAIIGSILSIIVIVIYGKLTASKEEKARKSHLKTKDILNAWSIYLLILFLIILTSPLFPGLRHTLENNWITENQSAYQCVHRQLYYFLADSCRSIAFHRYFYRWIDSGG